MLSRKSIRTSATDTAERAVADSLIRGLVSSGIDLRSLSLEEMKRRLVTAVAIRRDKDLASSKATSAV